MSRGSEKDEIKNLIADCDLKAAMRLLIDITHISNTPLHDETILLSMQLSNLEKDTRIGKMDWEKALQIRVRIASGMLQIIHSIG